VPCPLVSLAPQCAPVLSLCSVCHTPPNTPPTLLPQQHGKLQSVLKAAKREFSSVVSLADFCRSPCMLPAAEKTRSTPAEEAGAAKYCLTIFASAGHLLSLSFHQSRTLKVKVEVMVKVKVKIKVKVKVKVWAFSSSALLFQPRHTAAAVTLINHGRPTAVTAVTAVLPRLFTPRHIFVCPTGILKDKTY
jgi:hypothetical protein